MMLAFDSALPVKTFMGHILLRSKRPLMIYLKEFGESGKVYIFCEFFPPWKDGKHFPKVFFSVTILKFGQLFKAFGNN